MIQKKVTTHKKVEKYYRGHQRYVHGSASLHVDQDKIKQVIFSLLSNTLKYTPQHGKIEIDITQTEEYFNFSVKDNGCGISQKDVPHIFKRFYRAHKA